MPRSSSGPDKEIGARFRWIREHSAKGFRSQPTVAREIGISLSHYSKIEVGIDPFSEIVARNFCRVYDANYEWLITGEGQPFLTASAVQPRPFTRQSAQDASTEKHGHTEECRELVFAAVAETERSLADTELMKDVDSLAKRKGKSRVEILGWFVWDEVRNPQPK